VSIHEDIGHFALATFDQTGQPSPILGYPHGLAKRALDLAIAVPLLILLSPLMIALAVAIRLSSSGPALFRQTRLGTFGAPFRIFKFRTMNVLEDGAAIAQASEDDKRVTSVGRWMRRLSLDELPQFINVINGDMSMIGPRPHAIAHDLLYGKLIDGYHLRQAVKPGISGWAQIHGHRGATPTTSRMRERLAYDVWYAKNASIALDIQIALRTIGAILRPRNAY